MGKEGNPLPRPKVKLDLEIPPMPPAWADPQALHNWEDYVAWIADVGRWDEQIDNLKQNGHLNGNNTTFDKDLS